MSMLATEPIQEFSPVVVESIGLSNFPAVAFYVKQVNNYILYQNREREMTYKDLERLRKAGTRFVYVRGADIDTVSEFFETNLEEIVNTNHESGTMKSSILGPIMVGYVSDIFKKPEEGGTEYIDKCRVLLKKTLGCITGRAELMDFLSKVVHNKVCLFTHSSQVAILSMFVHQNLFNVDQDEILDVGIGALFHDIGMIYVSSDILEKTDTFSQQEFFRIRHHPRNGHDLLVKMGIKSPVSLSIPLYHHERYNGTGYPKRLFENEIPRSALVAAICDTYCDLTTSRPYRPASTPRDALKLMWKERRLFHPEILDGFLSLMGYHGRDESDGQTETTPQRQGLR